MRKSDKKIENQLIKMLTDVCEHVLKEFDGFMWVTHDVNYNNFPDSLRITCVFETSHHLTHFLTNNNHLGINSLLAERLTDMGIKLSNPSKHVEYTQNS